MPTCTTRALQTGWLLAAIAVALTSARVGAQEPLEDAPLLVAQSRRLQADFGIAITLASDAEPARATTLDVTPLAADHLENALNVLAWVEAELRRYPAGFLREHGPRNLVLANAYVSKAWKGEGAPFSPAFIAEKSSNSLLVTVPSTITPATEILGRSSLHQMLFAYLLASETSPDEPIALERWKSLASEKSFDDESAARLVAQSNLRESLFRMLWQPFESAELQALAKDDPLLRRRIGVVHSFMSGLDPRFDEAFWSAMATIPESQRTVCLNDLGDPHSADRIRSDREIQDDLGLIEQQWGLEVLWEPGSPAPPMPARVRLEYSYFTDAKLPRFRAFIRMLREELEPYPSAIVTKLDVRHLYVLDDFTFRGAGVAGQSFSWLPRASVAYGIRTFDPAQTASQDFYRRTIHHEVFHLMDTRFSVAGGPIHGANWDNLNEPGFRYKVGMPKAPDQPDFYADNATRQGFAEPYGMNVATDDRATLYARLISGDTEFLGRVRRDPILTAKVGKICEFFRLLARDLEIPASNPLLEKLQSIEAMVARQ